MSGFRRGTFIILLVICTMLFSNCNSKVGILSKSPELNIPFESDVKIQAGELEVSGSIKRYGTGIWEMRADSPETLAGLELRYNGDEGVKATLDDLSLDISAEDIRDGAVFAQIFKAIDSAAAANELSCTETEDGKVFSGEFSGKPYSMTFDPETLVPVRIEIPSAGISAELENFSPMTGETAQEDYSSVTNY